MADAQLLSYIIQQEHAGFTEEQIRVALAQNGYSSQAINEAFRELSPVASDPVVHDAAQEYARQGMPAAQVFTTLTNQGFSPAKARKAVTDVFGAGAVPSQHRAAMLAFAVIAGVVALGGLFFLLPGNGGAGADTPPPQQFVSLSPSEVIAEVLTTTRESGADAGVRACEERLSGRDRDLCVLDVAVLDVVSDRTLCSRVVDAEYHDACQLNFITADFDAVCSSVKLAKSKQTCESVAAFRGAAA